jgi:hypothetical protein
MHDILTTISENQIFPPKDYNRRLEIWPFCVTEARLRQSVGVAPAIRLQREEKSAMIWGYEKLDRREFRVCAKDHKRAPLLFNQAVVQFRERKNSCLDSAVTH